MQPEPQPGDLIATNASDVFRPLAPEEADMVSRVEARHDEIGRALERARAARLARAIAAANMS